MNIFVLFLCYFYRTIKPSACINFIYFIFYLRPIPKSLLTKSKNEPNKIICFEFKHCFYYVCARTLRHYTADIILLHSTVLYSYIVPLWPYYCHLSNNIFQTLCSGVFFPKHNFADFRKSYRRTKGEKLPISYGYWPVEYFENIKYPRYLKYFFRSKNK